MPGQMDICHTDADPIRMVACRECGHLHQMVVTEERALHRCRYCGAQLYRSAPSACGRPIALYLSALMLWIIVNSFPLLSLQTGDRLEQSYLISGAVQLYQQGMAELALVVLLTSVLFPAVIMIGMLWLLFNKWFDPRYAPSGRLVQTIYHFAPWSMVGVMMFAVLLSIIKLQDMATVVPGISLYALFALLVVLTAAERSFHRSMLWPPQEQATLVLHSRHANPTIQSENLLSCHTCNQLIPADGVASRCPRCGASLHHMPRNHQVTVALVVTAALLLIPANLYPIMTIVHLGQGEPSTIMGGVIKLIEAEMWPIALIVFFASILVPLLKLMTLIFLVVSVHKQSDWRRRDRTRIYRVAEAIGSWSMVDVFLVALLSALVNFGELATIQPGIAATFFGAAVIVTMLAAHRFDPQTIWYTEKVNG